MRFPLLVALGLTLAPSVARAQDTWMNVGATVQGDTVSVDTSSVQRTGALVMASVRVVYVNPVKRNESWWASWVTQATFDCAGHVAAAREIAVFADVRSKHVIQRKVNKEPGFGAPPKGSMNDLAMQWVCAEKDPAQESRTAP